MQIKSEQYIKTQYYVGNDWILYQIIDVKFWYAHTH